MRRIAFLSIALIWFAGAAVTASASGATNGADLLAIVDLALRHDPGLQAAREERDAGREARPQGRAGLLPTLSLSGERSRERRWADQLRLDGESVRQRRELDRTSIRAELTQPLIRLENWFAYRESIHRAQGSNIEFDETLQSFRLRLIRAYLDTLRAQLRMDTVRSRLEAVKAQKRQAESRMQAGLSSRLDLSQAKAEYSRVRAELVQVRSEVEERFRELEAFTGIELWRLAPLRETFDPRDEALEPLEHYVQTGLRESPVIRGAELQEKAATQNARRAGAAHLPTLDLSLHASRDTRESDIGGANGFAELPETESDSVVLSLQLNVPLFQGGRTTSAYREARSRAAQADEQRRAAVEQARLRIEVSHRNLRNLRDVLTAAEASLEAQEAALEATQRSYQSGLQDSVDVVRAQRALFEAMQEREEARLDYLGELARLRAATGNLDRAFLETLNRWLEAA